MTSRPLPASYNVLKGTSDFGKLAFIKSTVSCLITLILGIIQLVHLHGLVLRLCRALVLARNKRLLRGTSRLTEPVQDCGLALDGFGVKSAHGLGNLRPVVGQDDSLGVPLFRCRPLKGPQTRPSSLRTECPRGPGAPGSCPLHDHASVPTATQCTFLEIVQQAVLQIQGLLSRRMAAPLHINGQLEGSPFFQDQLHALGKITLVGMHRLARQRGPKRTRLGRAPVIWQDGNLLGCRTAIMAPPLVFIGL